MDFIVSNSHSLLLYGFLTGNMSALQGVQARVSQEWVIWIWELPFRKRAMQL